MLTRSELIEKLGEFEFWPEIALEFEEHLRNAISSKDLELVRLLLNAGANPNAKEDLHCYLFLLLHEYMVTKSTTGNISLDIMNELLNAGADPNRVVQCNLRAYDYAVGYRVKPMVEMLERYGAEKKALRSNINLLFVVIV